MKLSYTIRKWKDLSWDELVQAALDARLTGLEIEDVNSPIFQDKTGPANPELSSRTRRALAARKLSVPCVNTTADLTDPEFADEFMECLTLAVNLNVPSIGVHSNSEDQDQVISQVRELLDKIGNKPVSILIETKEAFANTSRLRDILNHFADDRLAATWDMAETYGVGKEEAEQTITNLGAYVRHVHLHDFRMAEILCEYGQLQGTRRERMDV